MKTIVTSLLISIASASAAGGEQAPIHDKDHDYQLTEFGSHQLSAYAGMNLTDSSDGTSFGGSADLRFTHVSSSVQSCAGSGSKTQFSHKFIGYELMTRGEFLEGTGASNLTAAAAGTTCFTANDFLRAEIGNIWDISQQDQNTGNAIGFARSTIHGPYTYLSYLRRERLFEWDVNLLGGRFDDGPSSEDTMLVSVGVSVDVPGGIRYRLRVGATKMETSGRSELLSVGVKYNLYGSWYLQGSVEQQWWHQERNRVYGELGVLCLGW